MWINDDDLASLINGWDGCSESGSYGDGVRQCAADLRGVIEKQAEMLPPPSEGSERCMIYTKGPR